MSLQVLRGDRKWAKSSPSVTTNGPSPGGYSPPPKYDPPQIDRQLGKRCWLEPSPPFFFLVLGGRSVRLPGGSRLVPKKIVKKLKSSCVAIFQSKLWGEPPPNPQKDHFRPFLNLFKEVCMEFFSAQPWLAAALCISAVGGVRILVEVRSCWLEKGGLAGWTRVKF